MDRDYLTDKSRREALKAVRQRYLKLLQGIDKGKPASDIAVELGMSEADVKDVIEKLGS